MKTQPRLNLFGTPQPLQKDHAPYIELFVEAVHRLHKNKNAPDHIDEPIADQIIYMAFLVLPLEEWKSKFLKSSRAAFSFYRNSRSYWQIVALALSTPKVEAAILELLPCIDREKYFPTNTPDLTYQNIGQATSPATSTPIPAKPPGRQADQPPVKKPFNVNIALGLARGWRLDPRWEKLYPCSKQLFYRLVYRTYRKDIILKVKNTLARGETFFPYCRTGIKSLTKQLTYHRGGSTILHHYENCQIKKALRQLWNLGFVHREFRGYLNQGVGKYRVFLNPRMSATFHRARLKAKPGAIPKKRPSRMT